MSANGLVLGLQCSWATLSRRFEREQTRTSSLQKEVVFARCPRFGSTGVLLGSCGSRAVEIARLGRLSHSSQRSFVDVVSANSVKFVALPFVCALPPLWATPACLQCPRTGCAQARLKLRAGCGVPGCRPSSAGTIAELPGHTTCGRAALTDQSWVPCYMYQVPCWM